MIIITAPVHPYLLHFLEEKGYAFQYVPDISYNELEERIGIAEGLFVTTRLSIDKNLLSKAELLKWIGRLGSGMELIDVDYALSKNIVCTSSPEGNRNAVAEHTLGLLLNVFRNIHKSVQEIEQGKWKRESNRGTELYGKTIGIIGFGNTGSAFAKILAGFDVTILAYDKYKFDFGGGNIKESSLEEVCKHADVISFHVPLTTETAYLCNDAFFKNVASTPLIINTSRGGVVQISSILRALQQGIISGAALDVLENENLHLFSEQEKADLQHLLQHEKVVITPHIAGYTHEAFLEMSKVLIGKLGL